jgi:hypothetical protein
MQKEETDKILEIVPLRIMTALTIAMALHPRLGEKSKLGSLDQAIVVVIAGYAMPGFSGIPFWRLCQMILFDHFRQNLVHEIDEYILCIGFPESSSFIRITACGFPGHKNIDNASDDSSDGSAGDAASDSGSDEDISILLEAACIYFKHSTFHAFVVRPDVPTTIGDGRELTGMTLHDPRDEANIIHGIEFLDVEDAEDACYRTEFYILSDTEENKEPMNVVDIAINIATTTTTDGPVCPKCGVAVGDGGMPDALCAACERRQTQQREGHAAVPPD